ncbi:UDP-glucuronosyltransferase 2C1 [Strongylocentrotus purpuratus]|uniref:UDP-glucuronosyltransferase n=1 Tax=Strongylocentrotus purpuratus TaxID=7668 RepID=A0A7M7HN19_STRPU|nr:UDP-glucuronosyltransferase 2C1 [Strongylocentrotus purpuratus]
MASFRFPVVLAMGMALIMVIPRANGAKFLATLFHPMAQASHNRFVGGITTSLIGRGHEVTVLAADTYDFKGLKKDVAATRVLTFKAQTPSSVRKEMGKALSADQASNPTFQLLSELARLAMMLKALNYIAVQNCADMFDNRDVMNGLLKEKFDLLLVEMFEPCDALLAEYLNVPFVVMTGSLRHPVFNEHIYNIPIPSSYVPFNPSGALTDEMSFSQRLQNFLEANVFRKLLDYMQISSFRTIQLQHNIGTAFSVRELIGRAELWLCHIDFALDFPHPIAPNWISIAGLLSDAETKPLPKDLEDFVQGSGDHGVIVFSLGSTDMNLLNSENDELFAKAFSQLPQRVLWKYIGSPPRYLGNNTRLMSWLPQSDLLAHPKTKLLFYHGGMAGVYEAMHFKKPMVLLPLFADQPGIGARIEKKGMGVVLSKSSLSVEAITTAIRLVLTDPSYKTNVEKYGSISKDTIVSPMETAMFWIEHINKFGGSHLKSRAGELNFITLNSLDVVAFILIIVLLGLYLDYVILRSCYRFMCGRKTVKTKSD